MGFVEIKSVEDLPPENKYVIAKHNRGTWIDEGDQENVNTVVVKLIKGLSKEDRLLMEEGKIENPLIEGWNKSDGTHFIKKSKLYSGADVFGNNLVPYNWQTFGADSFFGQSITHWMEIPKLGEKL